jgi:DNA segregation ATPase FtsK/SpoIIIE, S-DNA-T family
MTDPRKIEFDIEALILSAGCVFLWSSLLSYDPADSLGEFPTWLSGYIATDIPVYPPNETIQNRCGWFGALVAHLMVQALGISSILIATGLSVLAIWMFRVQSNYVTIARQLGWVLIIIASTTFFALLELNNPLSPVIGAGGYLGKLTSLWLNQHFAWVGSFILTLTVMVSGVLLSTDYYVVRAIARALQFGTRMVSTAAVASKDRVRGPMSQVIKPRRLRSDVDDGVQLDAANSVPEPWRIWMIRNCPLVPKRICLARDRSVARIG